MRGEGTYCDFSYATTIVPPMRAGIIYTTAFSVSTKSYKYDIENQGGGGVFPSRAGIIYVTELTVSNNSF
ncbi:hypothetical protein ES703_40036 [subsurface metagenome]